MKSLKYLIPLSLFAVLTFFLLRGLSLNPKEVPSPLIGKPAPEFTLPQLHKPDASLSRADLLGQVYVLNVWASWCAACRDEHPALVDFARRQVVPIYGLNYKDDRMAGIQWLNRLGNPYVASIHDFEGKLGIDFGVYGVPETFVIDREGIIRYKHIGPVNPQILRETIEPLVKSLQG